MMRRQSPSRTRHTARITGLSKEWVSHSRKHTRQEKTALIMPQLVSLGLIPLTVAPFAMGSVNPVTDAILGAAVIIHSHIGFECVFPPSMFNFIRLISSLKTGP